MLSNVRFLRPIRKLADVNRTPICHVVVVAPCKFCKIFIQFIKHCIVLWVPSIWPSNTCNKTAARLWLHFWTGINLAADFWCPATAVSLSIMTKHLYVLLCMTPDLLAHYTREPRYTLTLSAGTSCFTGYTKSSKYFVLACPLKYLNFFIHF